MPARGSILPSGHSLLDAHRAWSRVEGGMLTERWVVSDLHGVLEVIGA
jgi:hypothetical protein